MATPTDIVAWLEYFKANNAGLVLPEYGTDQFIYLSRLTYLGTKDYILSFGKKNESSAFDRRDNPRDRDVFREVLNMLRSIPLNELVAYLLSQPSPVMEIFEQPAMAEVRKIHDRRIDIEVAKPMTIKTGGTCPKCKSDRIRSVRIIQLRAGDEPPKVVIVCVCNTER